MKKRYLFIIIPIAIILIVALICAAIYVYDILTAPTKSEIWAEETRRISSSLEIDEYVPVDSEEKALCIAEEFIIKKYNNSFSTYYPRASLNGNIWCVSYGKYPPDSSTIVLGGGGPCIYIDSTTGAIIRSYLQK